jgi:hypothetical protein
MLQYVQLSDELSRGTRIRIRQKRTGTRVEDGELLYGLYFQYFIHSGNLIFSILSMISTFEETFSLQESFRYHKLVNRIHVAVVQWS